MGKEQGRGTDDELNNKRSQWPTFRFCVVPRLHRIPHLQIIICQTQEVQHSHLSESLGSEAIGPRSLQSWLNHGSGVSGPSLRCLTSPSSAKGHPDNHQPLHDPPVPSGLAIPSPDYRPPHLFRSLLKLPMPDAPPCQVLILKRRHACF